MPDITPVGMTKHIYVCLYGEPGIGKSRFIGTSPGKVLIIRPPVDHLDSLLPADKARIEQWKVEDWNDMFDALDYLRHEGGKYDWVWVDSWSLLQDVLLDDLFETAVAEKPARRRYGADKQEYGINMFRIGSWMRHVVGPDAFNLGFTAHPAVLASPDLDEDGDPVEKLMPWIQGKNMSPKLCGYMNVVAFMEGVGKKRRRVIKTNSDERFYAKDQFDALGEDGSLLDPTMPKLLDLIKKSPGRATGGQRTNPTRTPKRTAKRRVTTSKGRN